MEKNSDHRGGATRVGEVQLRVWSEARQIARLMIATGDFTLTTLASAKDAEAQPFSGFLSDERDFLRAVYVSDGNLILQVQMDRWNLDNPSIVVQWNRLNPKTNRTKILVAGKTVFTDEYPAALADTLNANDPMFDSFDEEQEDFWLWLARGSRDAKWRANAVRQWSHSAQATSFSD